MIPQFGALSGTSLTALLAAVGPAACALAFRNAPNWLWFVLGMPALFVADNVLRRLFTNGLLEPTQPPAQISGKYQLESRRSRLKPLLWLALVLSTIFGVIQLILIADGARSLSDLTWFLATGALVAWIAWALRHLISDIPQPLPW